MNATWTDHDADRAIRLLRQGNPYFAVQDARGGYRPKRGEVAVDDVLKGALTVGFYAIRCDNLTRWGCLDFDDPPGDFTAKQWATVAQLGFDALSIWFPETWLEESSPGRFHAYAFADEPIPAADMREELRRASRHATELFPKQDRLGDDPKAKGSLVRFPGFHQKKKTWSRIVEIRGKTPSLCVPVPVTDPAREVEEGSVTQEGSVTGEARRYTLKRSLPMPLIPKSFASTARGQSEKKLFAMACALRNWEARTGEIASAKMRSEAFWTWWTVSAANVDRTQNNTHYAARWDRAYRNAKPSTGELRAAMADVSVLNLDGAARLDALCRKLADRNGHFFLDSRTAGDVAGWSHMTAWRWMKARYDLVSSVSYMKRKSNRWRGRWDQ